MSNSENTNTNNPSGNGEQEKLFQDFPPVSLKQWEDQISKDLKGADYKEKLAWRTMEGITVQPFYRREDLEKLSHLGTEPGEFPYVRGTREGQNNWSINQIIYAQKPEDANKKARHAIDRGASALGIFSELVEGQLQGVAIQNQEDFSKALEQVLTEDTSVNLDTGMGSPFYLAMLDNIVQERGLNQTRINANFVYDPLTFASQRGFYAKESEAWTSDLKQMLEFCTNSYPNVRCLAVDTRPYHNAGATAVQEMAYALAIGNEYLAKLTDAGLSVDDITPHMHFIFSIDSNYFMEIAKFRAVRMLWANLVSQYKPEYDCSSTMYIHAQTSDRNKTIYDPHNNMLRTTTEAMSAAIGGAQMVTTKPYDEPFKQPDQFSERIARNAQIIIKEESYLNKVNDPAAGSYYVEMLTDSLAKAAWENFKEVEESGGFEKALNTGTIQQRLAEIQERRNQKVAQRRFKYVGTNQYPNDEERASEKLQSYPPHNVTELKSTDDDFEVDTNNVMDSLKEAANAGNTISSLRNFLIPMADELPQSITQHRDAQAYEQLRLATERYEKKHGKRPLVFMLTMGNPKMRKARSTFASNFFGCAGYEISDHLGFETVDEAMKAVEEEQPDIMVICSSDKEYSELVEPICEQSKQLAKEPIKVLAGYPKDQIEDLQKAGIDTFIHIKSNALEELQNFHQKLGIEF